MPYRCEACGLEKAESVCSSTDTLICVGYRGMEGCGKVLSAEERHYYGDCCEACMQSWSDEIDKWKSGGKNELFDKQFSDVPQKH